MSETVAPEAESCRKTMNPRTCYRKTLERSRFPALQISQAGKRLETGTANLAPPALQISHLWLCKCRRAAI